MAKKKARKKTKRSPSSRRAGSGRKTASRSKSGARRSGKSGRNTGRRPAGSRTLRGKARKRAPARRQKPASRPAVRTRRGGTGREETLAQTPETGRTVRGRTNPMPTRRSTGTPAGAGSTKSPALTRRRRRLREVEENVPTPPSSLDLDRTASAARTGRHEMQEARREHNETSPVLTGGDVDANWEDAYSVGDEAPGGDNPTPDQDRVDDIGRALGVEYQDNEELRASDKIADRDRHRWELDPASSEDYRDRD